MSDWKSILQYMYERQDEWMRGGKNELISELEDEFDCTETELRPSISYLKRMGLIEEVKGGAIDALDLDSMLVVTEKGFDVAHERELRKRQQNLIEKQNSTTRRMAELSESQTHSSKTVATLPLSWPLQRLSKLLLHYFL